MEILDLKRKALEIRMGAITLVHQSKGHIGGTMSSADIIAALFYRFMRFDPKKPDMPDRDRFILSKGHTSEGYYWALADLGFYDPEELENFTKFRSIYQSHPSNDVNGIELSTGALGHGLSLACGVALSSKLTGIPFRTYVLLGDGETDEGSIWEGAMLASARKLDNLFVFIDRNGMQISGSTEMVLPLEPYRDKWEAFGFDTIEVDGNDMEALCRVIGSQLENRNGKPKAFICRTQKGRGVSFMEGNKKWHHGSLNQEQYEQAMEDLKKEMEALKDG